MARLVFGTTWWQLGAYSGRDNTGMKTFFLLFAVIFLASSPSTAGPNRVVEDFDRHPIRAVAEIEALTLAPYASNASIIKQDLNYYRAHSKRFKVTLDPVLMRPLLTDQSLLSRDLLVQYYNGLLLYAIEKSPTHRAGLDDEAQCAGIESMLDGYRHIKEARPSQRNDFAESLQKANLNGDLVQYVHTLRTGAGYDRTTQQHN